jgi:hypothetical protein
VSSVVVVVVVVVVVGYRSIHEAARTIHPSERACRRPSPPHSIDPAEHRVAPV